MTLKKAFLRAGGVVLYTFSYLLVSACDFSVPKKAMPESLFEITKKKSFNASVSSVDESTEPHHSRLSSDNGWIPSNTDGDDLWLQVDLGVPQFIAMLQLSRPNSDKEEYVTKAYMQCSLDGVEFIPFVDFATGKRQVFQGSADQTEHKTWLHLCRFVRILPKSWVGRPALRWDLLRCPSEFTLNYI